MIAAYSRVLLIWRGEPDSHSGRERLLPRVFSLPPRRRSGERDGVRGSPVITAQIRLQPLRDTPLPSPLPAAQGEGIRGDFWSILRSPPYVTEPMAKAAKGVILSAIPCATERP